MIRSKRLDIKQAIKNAFNAAEKSYDDYSNIQYEAGKRLIAHLLPLTPASPRIIDLGCGTGRVTQQLASRLNYLDFHAIDIAEKLLLKARARLSSTITVYEADFDHLPAYEQPFDIIFSNMALQWSTCLIATFTKIKKLVRSNSLFAFTLPLPETFQELPPHYARHCFFAADFIHEILNVCGYDILVSDTEKKVISFDHLLSALRSIKKTGATCGGERRNGRLVRKSLVLQSAFQLTYHIGYFVACYRGIRKPNVKVSCT